MVLHALYCTSMREYTFLHYAAAVGHRSIREHQQKIGHEYPSGRRIAGKQQRNNRASASEIDTQRRAQKGEQQKIRADGTRRAGPNQNKKV